MSFWKRLTSGLARSASKLGEGIANIGRRKLDAATLENLEDLLIESDLGIETASRIVEALGRTRHDAELSGDEIKTLLAAEVEKVLAPVAKP
jgi:fused signal recognition particle receptor